MEVGGGAHDHGARILRRQDLGDSPHGPRTTEIEAYKMEDLAIGEIVDHGGLSHVTHGKPRQEVL